MRDHDQRARPLAEKCFDEANRLQVEVVRRFVEEQYVGPLGEREQQLQTPSLAAGELPGFGGRKGASEPEPLHQCDVGEGARYALGTGDEFLHGQVQIEVAAVLFEVRRHDGRAAFHGSLRRFDHSSEQVEKRRLSSAVGSDDAHAVTGADLEIDVLEDLARAVVGEGNVVGPYHHGAEAGCVDAQVERSLASGSLRTLGEQAQGRVDSGLGFRRAGLHAATQPRQFGPGEVASRLLGRGRLLLALGLGLQQS